jgi:perosamine synthetase
MNNKLAIHGGNPIRQNTLQYGKQTIDKSDKEAILRVLDENTFLTTGPKVVEFEEECKKYCGAKYALAVSSCTAALHCAMASLELKPTDEVIVSGISFVASSNCVIYCGATPVFCDIEENTMNIDPEKIESLINTNTRAIISVDFAGQLCDYDRIKDICKKYNLYLIQDAAHSWGIGYNNEFVGNIADITTVSFHPVKNMTTCEGGMIFTNNTELYNKMKLFRSHGISTDFNEREKTGQLYSPMITLGYHYRICDLLCALGINQLKNLSDWIQKRNDIAKIYKIKIDALNNKFNKKIITYLNINTVCAYHIFIIKLDFNNLSCNREVIFKSMKAEGIGVNIHYLPIYMHPFYQSYLKIKPHLPICNKTYGSIITLPLFPSMKLDDIEDVILALDKVIHFYVNKN